MATFRIENPLVIVALMSGVLVSCEHHETDKLIFTAEVPAAQSATYKGWQPGQTRQPDLALTDMMVFQYAERIAQTFAFNMTGNRRARMASNNLDMGLTTVTAAADTFSFSESTVAWLGLGQSTIDGAQSIYNARERSLIYKDSLAYIESAMGEYLTENVKHNTGIPTYLSPNGVILYQRVKAAEFLVDKTLTGRLATQEDLARASEAMLKTEAATQPIAGGRAYAMTDSGDDSFKVRKAAFEERRQRAFNTTNREAQGVDAGTFDDAITLAEWGKSEEAAQNMFTSDLDKFVEGVSKHGLDFDSALNTLYDDFKAAVPVFQSEIEDLHVRLLDGYESIKPVSPGKSLDRNTASSNRKKVRDVLTDALNELADLRDDDNGA